MLRLSMLSAEQVGDDWRERVEGSGISLNLRHMSQLGTTIVEATFGEGNLLLEVASGREVGTCIAYPNERQVEMASILERCGVARVDVCHVGQVGRC